MDQHHQTAALGTEVVSPVVQQHQQCFMVHKVWAELLNLACLVVSDSLHKHK